MRKSLLLLPLLLLAGCDQLEQKLGLEDPAKKEAKQEAEGKAVGSACRQSGRAIEDCYSIYSWLPKSPIFEGWKEMDAYMRENKIDTIAPQLPPPEPPGAKKKKKPASEDTAAAEIKLEKASDKPLDPNGDRVGEKGGEKGSEKAEEKAGEKSTDKSSEKAAEKPAEKSAGKH